MKTIQELAELSLSRAVLIDFWAEWCGPCKTFGPVLEKTLAPYGDQIHLEKVDVDEQRDLAAQLRVQSIPTIVLLHQGKIAGVSQGALSESQLDQWLKKHLPDLENLSEELDQKEIIEQLPPIPSENRLSALRKLAQENPGDTVLLSEYCRALLFDQAGEAKELAAELSGNQELHWLSTQIDYLANAILNEEASDELSQSIVSLIKSGELDRAAAKLNELLLTAKSEEKEDIRKLGVSLFSVLGDQHPVNKKHRKIFNMYLS